MFLSHLSLVFKSYQYTYNPINNNPTFNTYYSYIIEVNFIGAVNTGIDANKSTRRTAPIFFISILQALSH